MQVNNTLHSQLVTTQMGKQQAHAEAQSIAEKKVPLTAKTTTPKPLNPNQLHQFQQAFQNIQTANLFRESTSNENAQAIHSYQDVAQQQSREQIQSMMGVDVFA